MDIKMVYNYKKIYFMCDPHISETIRSFFIKTLRPHHKMLFSQLAMPQNMQCLFTLKSAAHYTVDSGHLTIRKERPDYQILLTKAGEASVFYDGNHYILGPGNALVINCEKEHRYEVLGENFWEYKHVHFTTNNPELLLNMVPVFVPDFNQADRHFDELEAYTFTPEAMSQIAPYVYSNFISNILTDLLKAKYTLPGDESQKKFLEISQYIRNNFAEPISLEDIAQKFHYSESYFIRLFKKYYNETPYQYLIRYRLAKVKELTREGVTVQKASLSCGFNSTSAYYHALKKENDFEE